MVFWPGLCVLFVSQNSKELCVSFSLMDSVLCTYHLVVESNFRIWIIYLVLHSFRSCLLHFLSYQLLPVVFHWSLNDNTSLQISKTLLSILADCCCLNDLDPSSVLQSHQLLFNVQRDCSNGSNYIWYHCHLHVPQYFHNSNKSTYLSSFSPSFIFPVWSAWTDDFIRFVR